CPTRRAVDNLAAEGIEQGVRHVGDVMYDAALAARARVERTAPADQGWSAYEPGTIDVATVHRAENVDDPAILEKVLAYLRDLAEQRSDGSVVMPVHPRTRKAIEASSLSTGALATTEPVGYLEMTYLLTKARTVYTDSGGLQKEAYFHRVPCVKLRDETEWVETVEAGWNRLCTVPEYAPRREIDDYGDGHAGRLIVEVLAEELAAR